MLQTEESKLIKATSTHAEYIDIARVVAAFSIIILHSSIDWMVKGGVSSALLNGRVPFFFLIAGYFARYSSFKSMLQRLRILVIPFLLWDTIPALLFDKIQWSEIDFYSILTLKTQFNGPLWFLKNLIVYALIFPIIYPFRKYALPVALFLLMVFSLKIQWGSTNIVRILHPMLFGFGFFSLGLSLQSITIDAITGFFTKNYKRILSLAFFIILVIDIYGAVTQQEVIYNPFVQIYGIITILSLGLAISIHFPKVGKLLLHIAPATYLIFLCHYSVCYAIRIHGTIPWLTEFYYAYNYIATFCTATAIVLFSTFFVKFLRKFIPPLLPIIAGIKK